MLPRRHSLRRRGTRAVGWQQRCTGPTAVLGPVANASDERVYEFTDLTAVGRAGVFLACWRQDLSVAPAVEARREGRA